MAGCLADAGGRALGSTINKYKHLTGLGYYIFIKLYMSRVSPILDYALQIWGLQSFPKIDSVQNRAIRDYVCIWPFIITRQI